jgi:hypothetical protein
MSDAALRTSDPGQVTLLPGRSGRYCGLGPTLLRQQQHQAKRRTDPGGVGKYAGFKYYGRTIPVPSGVTTTGCQQPPLQAILSVARGSKSQATIWRLFKQSKGVAPTIRTILGNATMRRQMFPNYRIAALSRKNTLSCFQGIRGRYPGKNGFFIGVGDMSSRHYGIHAFVGSWAYKITGATNPGVIAEVHWREPATSPRVHEFRTFENFATQWKIVTVWIFVKK